MMTAAARRLRRLRECGYIHIEAEPRDYTALKPPRLILVIKYAIEAII